MQSTVKSKPTDDPHDILVVAPDAVRVTPADADEEFSSQAEPVRMPSAPTIHVEPIFMTGAAKPPVDDTFRATGVNAVDVDDAPVKSRRGRAIAKRAMRAVGALLMAACIGGAAMAWHYHAEAAQQIIAEWAPLFTRKASQPSEKTGLADQPALAAAEADAPSAPPAQPAPAQPAAVQAAPQAPAAAAATAPTTVGTAPPAATEAAAPVAAAPTDETQSLETMARDLATAGKEIEQLKASIEQLKASQQQLVTMISEKEKAQSQRAKKPPTPPRPVSALTPSRTPPPPGMPSRPLRQTGAPIASAAAVPAPTAGTYVPRQIEPQPRNTAETLDDPELVSVPRPPMPLR